MYSYQHRYHAGNFADLHKHIVLLAVLTYLQHKPTSIGILDAFAGEGLYDLELKEAQKNQEYLSGYGLIQDFKSEFNFELFIQLLKITSSYSDVRSGLKNSDHKIT